MAVVSVNVAGIFGNAENNRIGVSVGAGKDRNGQVRNGSFFIGGQNQNGDDRIEQRRKLARKQASKYLMDQFDRDSKVTDEVKERRGRNTEIKEEISSIREQIKGLTDAQEAMRLEHGVMPDSEEQKQLDMIRKVNKAMKTGKWDGLSKDELLQVANMDTSQLTSYQKFVLRVDAAIDTLEKDIPDLEKESRMNNSTIVELKQGLLKTSYKGISKAYEAADVIMDAASDEIMGMLVQDAKNYLDEKLQELVEAAKKKAEEKEEEEEKKEAAEEKKEAQEELTEAILEANSDNKDQLAEIAENIDTKQTKPEDGSDKLLEIAEEQEDLQKTVEKMLRDAGLLDFDVKGLMVDGFF